ncbi:hypothetical protein A6A03_15130 [Chloroflexus islandicus]|uniref:DUF4276 family protein n=1 Tax=Chloroflexus islandicus TaxID=1707952 RepID=A0A178MAM5_9CHLR|nr:DUF4276 family protein [Chloroflexus islandicus]OAN45237.1 hypothetical protein A6A03_15130 [Chloroflexus islandicus]
MKRILILCEGQTEESFVNDILNPHLVTYQRWAVPILAVTKRTATGSHRGGIVSYDKMRHDIIKLLRDSDARCVTTMIDYYGLPADFPGKAIVQGQSPHERVAALERALADDISDRRFYPFLMLHEFEALLFSAPDILKEHLRPSNPQRLFGSIAQFATPEEINDGPDTHPAARITRSKPDYSKRIDGILIAKAIGLATMRERCPHFDQWVGYLETC